MKMGFMPLISFNDYYNSKPKKIETKEDILSKVNKIISSIGGV